MSAPSQKVPQSFVSERPDGLLCYRLLGQDRYGCGPYCYASGFAYSGQQVAADGSFQCDCCMPREGGAPPSLPLAEQPATSPGLWQMLLLPSMPPKTYEPSERWGENGIAMASWPAGG